MFDPNRGQASCVLPHIGGGPTIHEHDEMMGTRSRGNPYAALLSAPVQKPREEEHPRQQQHREKRARTKPAVMRAAPPECVDKLDRGLLRACALSWAAISAPLLLDPSAVALQVFGLDVSGG